MKIRAIKSEDTLPILNIHKQFYESEFALPSLMDNKNYMIYSILDDNNKLITVGILRQILELVQLTDKSFPVITRRDALIKSLGMASATADNLGFSQIHAFVQDPNWANILKEKAGFFTCKGEALYHNSIDK